MSLFDDLSALAEPTRGRLLLALEGQELAVSELCTVLQLPQSTVSRHLKVLADGGWSEVHPEGTSRLYRADPERLTPARRELWNAVRGELAATPEAGHDAQRLESVLAQRVVRSQEFFQSSAGEWDRLRRELFGRQAGAPPLLGLLDAAWTVGDLGCGTGEASLALAPFVRRVVAVDASPSMLGVARQRLAALDNVEVRAGELESPPLVEGELDAAVLFLVLHHVADPARVLAATARGLAPGGRVLVVDMNPHGRQEYRDDMGHVWLGFDRNQLGRWCEEAGLGAFRLQPLPPDPEAKGPTLFAASAAKSN
ncbi:MAG: metalloregulator ArsR/SmtB family transcription factor [Acidobacteriota bacterium]